MTNKPIQVYYKYVDGAHFFFSTEKEGAGNHLLVFAPLFCRVMFQRAIHLSPRLLAPGGAPAADKKVGTFSRQTVK